MCPFPLKWGVSQLSTTHGSWDIEIPFFGIFWNSEINMKCNSFIPEIGGSVQVGVFFMMFPYPSSFIPKRPPSHLGGPQSGRGQFLTLGILFELINYSWNFNLGTSENFFFDWYAKIFQNVTPIPKFTKIGQTFMDLRTWPYLAQLINLIFINFFVFHYFWKWATWEGMTWGIKVSHQYLQIKHKKKNFWRPPSCHISDP